MPSTMGTTLRVSVFGQSHSEAIGCVVEGLPSGFTIDTDALATFMARRAPGQHTWSTPRREADAPHIVSGLNVDGATCGAPLAIIISNTDTRSADYDNLLRIPRPGHADLTAWEKWHGNQDVPGGGHFSGRLTAPLCAAGGIALQMLERRGVRVAAHLSEVAGVADVPFEAYDTSADAAASLASQMDALADGRTFPAISERAAQAMIDAIEDARDAGDSVGGVVECVATGLPAGIGSPMFDGLENIIARNVFGIPAVKGIEFGRGFGACNMHGSEHNDPYTVRTDDQGRPVCMPATNNAGGALGGISTGAPVLFRMAVKPTSSIGLTQQSVDLPTMQPADLQVKGRHDPCIAPRAVPVAEAVMALSLLDAWLSFPPEADNTEAAEPAR
jgi:chorismate synthase